MTFHDDLSALERFVEENIPRAKAGEVPDIEMLDKLSGNVLGNLTTLSVAEYTALSSRIKDVMERLQLMRAPLIEQRDALVETLQQLGRTQAAHNAYRTAEASDGGRKISQEE